MVMRVAASKLPLTNLRMSVDLPTPPSPAIITFKTSTEPSIIMDPRTKLQTMENARPTLALQS
ncbi:MAG: hypothetical protein RBG13Loki_2922 [Promethearchaeota archaeon CR_4]|nr:MAG: hypothetical protein RBG13Loki_2922 [Candidatus Lokiarchaeota archaeon CR_4]